MATDSTTTPRRRLTPLDAAFLEVESPTAHMHVGWVAIIDPGGAARPGDRPTFARIRNHVEARLSRAPRYRQRLANVPFGLHDPVWIDDVDFDIRRHVRHATASSLDAVINRVYSAQLDRRRPLWELWIADGLDDGRIAMIGKVHHCMVDGIAAAELATLFLDFEQQPAELSDDDEWRPSQPPGNLTLLAEGVRDRIGDELQLLNLPVELIRSPSSAFRFAKRAREAAYSIAHSVTPSERVELLHHSITAQRGLGRLQRPLADLRQVARDHDATINDVVLAVAAGGLRRFFDRAGERPPRLKTMVPVSVRDGHASQLGNAVSLVFIDLPCDEPDPARRLEDVQLAMSERKQAGEPLGAKTLLEAYGFLPHAVQHAFDRRVASAATFNLTVSNVPGPRAPLYMMGCPMQECYPVVPIADHHALAVGFGTVADDAFFGIYADRRLVPDPGLIASEFDEAIDELLAARAAPSGLR